jgi:hypothetical protein
MKLLIKNTISKSIIYIFVIVCILFLVIIRLLSIPRSNLGVVYSKDEELQVSIQCIDYSLQSDAGDILAYIYYDKPVVKGGKFSDEINCFFEAEQAGWLGSANRLTHYQEKWLQDFKEDVSDSIDSYGAEIVSEQPFIYTVDSNVVFHSDKYLSIRHIATVQKLGKRSWYYFGSNFDLETGELISIDKLVNIDAENFRNSIVDVLASGILDYNHNLSVQEIEAVYGTIGKDGYLIEYDGENVDLRYEYYFDEENYYVILNHDTLIDTGIIMKWNGKLFDDFEAHLVGYVLKDDGTYRLIEY